MQQNRWTWGLDGRRRLTGWEEEIDWRADRGCSRVAGLGGQIAAAGRCGWGQDRNSKVGGSDGWGQRGVLLGSRQAQTDWTDICLVLCNLGSRGGAAVFAGFKSWFKSWTSGCGWEQQWQLGVRRCGGASSCRVILMCCLSGWGTVV